MMLLFPLARTPMDESGARAMRNLQRDLRKLFYDDLTPWESMHKSIRAQYRGKIKPGTVAVVLDNPALAKDPLFKGAKKVK